MVHPPQTIRPGLPMTRIGIGIVQGLLLLACSSVSAQSGYIDQDTVADILNLRAESLDHVPQAYYEYHTLKDARGNNALARNNFFRRIGDGDTQLGRERSELVQMINRRLIRTYQIGDTVVTPTRFDLDFRAYSPFPRYYQGGLDFDKLFIMDKTLQAFAAYEYGVLMRWGIINTGNPKESPTPNGRYNFNWREPYRVSTLSPPGEEWEMYWVMNFHQARGMHVHQYEMPTGGPLSHGCVRLVDADAKWVFDWADTWTVASGKDDISSIASRFIAPGTTVLIIGDEPPVRPELFRNGPRYPILRHVSLPSHPYDIPPGTAQQRRLDKARLAAASTG